MIKTSAADLIARKLYEAEKQKRPLGSFAEAFPELDERAAYEVQERLIEIKCREENTVRVGRKLGLTSKAKQRMIGHHEPAYGVLLENMQLPADEPISVSPFIHAKVEPEIAFIFHKELKGPFVSAAEVLRSTAYIVPALEVIDSRFENFRFSLADGISDNSSSSRFILGEKTYFTPDRFDLRLMGMVLRKNGEVVSTAAGAAVMGDPARAIAWLAGKLYQAGQSIKPGEIVLSGSLSASLTIEAGDQYSVYFDGMGSIEVSFSE